MIFRISAFLGALLSAQLNAQIINTIADYNDQLPYWGVTWAPGNGATNGYYPSFYTGFAMRSQFPERVHVRIARGNQTRVSVILDEQTVSDYLFDLVKRSEFYTKATQSGPYEVAPRGGKMLPQLEYFNQIIYSPVYGISTFVADAKAGRKSAEEIYTKSLEVLTALNPGRVFALKIDLKSEFLKWKQEIAGQSVSSDKEILATVNKLVWGRVNATDKPSARLVAKLEATMALALQGSEESFVAAALELFKEATGTKYQIQVVNGLGQFEDAIQCSVSSCTLTYPEFTAIYPTGTAMATMSDKFGNKINQFATPGLWNFVSRGARNVDNIRSEPYYGWAPKMDYQAIGNGFHNPAVRFAGIDRGVKSTLGIPADHNTLWAVKRGGVSHGCSRLPLGHLWEMRQIFPVEDAKMVKLQYFGNDSRDFDLYDIDGDGKPEIMGVEYFISYGLAGTSDLGRREGANLEVSNDRKLEFYTKLYGAHDVFEVNSQGKLEFIDPSVSLPSYIDYKKASVAIRLTIDGKYPLYEQTYEKDKVQFYTTGSINKGLIRLMGRVRGCAPSSDKDVCGEAAFDQEARSLLRN